MIFELLHSPYSEGYGEAVLPLEACKQHLKVDGDDDDDLISALRDAAIQVIELYCEVKLLTTPDLEWRAECFPWRSAAAIQLSVSPVISIEAVTWSSVAGAAVDGDPAAYRFSRRGDVLPAIGAAWPVGVAGNVAISFTAGYALGQAPPALLSAVKLFLGHLYKNREAITERGTEAEIPMGVRMICGPFCRVRI